MFDKKLKTALIGSAALIGGIVLLPTSALAVSCLSTISGTALSADICDFDIVSSVTISSGAVLGGIKQDGYHPTSSFITNNGTVSNDGLIALDAFAINISDSSLTNGFTNNGIIYAIGDAAVLVNNTSTISGGIINSGTITSQEMALQLDDNSTIIGDISNSGSIISDSINNPALLIRDNTTLNGNLNNSGIIRALGDGNGVHISNDSIINGNISNSGTMRGYNGLDLRTLVNVTGNITNSGTITGNTVNGLNMVQTSQVQGVITNNGTISGDQTGIFVDDISTISGGIKNYGTISGNVKAIYISSDSTVSSLDTYEGSVINGNIDATSTDVNYHGGDINGAISVNNFNIISGVVFNMDHAITAQTAVTNAGELLLGSTTQTITGDYVQSTGGILKIDAQTTANYGQLVAIGAINLSQSGTIDVNIIGTNLKTGNVLSNVISGTTLTVPTDGFNVTDNSQLLKFTAALNGGSNGVNLTVADDASTSIAASSFAGAGASSKLDEIIAANPSGDWQNVISAFNSLSNAQQVTNAANQTGPVLSGATNNAIIETMATAMRIVQIRQEFSAKETHRNLWLKPFGSWGNQGNKDGVIGYNSESYGIIGGVDQDISEQTNLGVGLSYFNSKLNSNNSNQKVNVDSFMALIYSNYKIDNRTEVNTQIAAGYNKNDSQRDINFGGLQRTARGNYDGWNLHAGTGLSRLLKIDRDTIITPQARLDYFLVGNQSYSESGAGVLDLDVASQKQAQLIPAVEVKAEHSFLSKFSVALNGGLGYDILHDENSLSAGFAGGGGSFVTQGFKPSPWIIRSGAGLTWKQSDQLDFTARYDRRDHGSSYDNQTLSLKLRLVF